MVHFFQKLRMHTSVKSFIGYYAFIIGLSISFSILSAPVYAQVCEAELNALKSVAPGYQTTLEEQKELVDQELWDGGDFRFMGCRGVPYCSEFQKKLVIKPGHPRYREALLAYADIQDKRIATRTYRADPKFGDKQSYLYRACMARYMAANLQPKSPQQPPSAEKVVSKAPPQNPSAGSIRQAEETNDWVIFTTEGGCIAYIHFASDIDYNDPDPYSPAVLLSESPHEKRGIGETKFSETYVLKSLTWSGTCKKGQPISGKGTLTAVLTKTEEGVDVVARPFKDILDYLYIYKSSFVDGFLNGNTKSVAPWLLTEDNSEYPNEFQFDTDTLDKGCRNPHNICRSLGLCDDYRFKDAVGELEEKFNKCLSSRHLLTTGATALPSNGSDSKPSTKRIKEAANATVAQVQQPKAKLVGSTPSNQELSKQQATSCSEEIRRKQLESQSWPYDIGEVSTRLGKFQKDLFEGRCAGHPEAQIYIAGAEKMLRDGERLANSTKEQSAAIVSEESLVQDDSSSDQYQQSTSASTEKTSASSSSSRKRKVHNPAADAKSCVEFKYAENILQRNFLSGGRFKNNCDSRVEVFWCNSDDIRRQHCGTWSLPAGGSFPANNEDKDIIWGACRSKSGEVGGGFDRDQDDGSWRYTCFLLEW